MRNSAIPIPWYFILKLLILVLLTINTALYASRKSWFSALDSAAWLLMLLLFDLKMEFNGRLSSNRFTTVMNVTRNVTILGVGVAEIAVLLESEWIDMLNSALWVALIVLLEFEEWFPRCVARWSSCFRTLGFLIFAALAGLVAVWSWQGEWFDAYDSLLWLVAFIIIELDLLRFQSQAKTMA